MTCSNVAKRLNINHLCSRKYFLKKENRACHKLRQYSLSNERDADYIRCSFSFNSYIQRSSRNSTIDERIAQVVGSDEFEMCNGLQAKLCRMVIERENNKTASINSVASTTATSSLETATTSKDNDELEDTCSLINNATIFTSDGLEIDDGDNS